MSSRVNRKCFAPNCTTGYASNKEHLSLFKVPKCPITREKWAKNIPRADRQLSDRDVICEKHFITTDVIKQVTINNITFDYKRPKLKPDAVPIFFSNSANHLSKNTYNNNRKRTATDILDIQDSSSIDEEPIPSTSTFIPVFPVAPKKKKDVFSDMFTLHTLSFLNWSIQYVDKPSEKQILLSQMTILNETPIMQKQIIANNKGIFYFYGQMRVPDTLTLPTNFNSQDDFCKCVENFENANICTGGPVSNSYLDIIKITECAQIDNSAGIWRHKKCPFIINDAYLKSCNFCNSLFKRFDRNRSDNKANKKRTRKVGFGYTVSKNDYKNEVLQKYNLKKLVTRRNKTIVSLKTKIVNLQREFKKLTESDVHDKLGNILSTQQIMDFKKCLNIGKRKTKNTRCT